MRLISKRIGPLWFFWAQTSFHFFYLFWVSRNAFSWQDMTLKEYKSIKNWHFLGLIFKLNCLSLLNTSSIWSNILSIVGAKIQMSLRYRKRVTNCWFPKHCSIKKQKLEPAFHSLNGIQVNSDKPIELTLNAVFLCCFPPLLTGGTLCQV